MERLQVSGLSGSCLYPPSRPALIEITAIGSGKIGSVIDNSRPWLLKIRRVLNLLVRKRDFLKAVK